MNSPKDKPETQAAIETLIDLFRQVDELCQNQPSKDAELWQRCQAEAQRELGEPEECKVELLAIEKYQQADAHYVKAWENLQGQVAAVAKQIDHTLFLIQDMFLNTPRNKRTVLAVDWGEIRNQSPARLTAEMLAYHRDGRFAKTIDALELYQKTYRSAYKNSLNLETGKSKAKPANESNGPGQAGETHGKMKMSKEEANVRARELLRETPTWDWTARKLAKQIPCSLGWIPYLAAWRAYHERRQELRRAKTIKTVSLSEELEAVLGTGDKDEVLKQLIAEQGREEHQDARQAKLYVSHDKKPRRPEG